MITKTTPIYLVFVDIKGGIQSNKYYNMFPSDTTFTVKYGRVGSTESTKTYRMHKWDSTYRSKIKKGYKDITHLKTATTVVVKKSNNSHFDEFYEKFAKYTGSAVSKNYISFTCTSAQLKEAQALLDKITKVKTKDKINESLLELYKVIPRAMRNVNDYLVSNIKDKNSIISREQDMLDSMSSSNIIHSDNIFDSLGIEFEKATKQDIKTLEGIIYPTKGNSSVKIYSAYKVKNKKNFQQFESHLSKQSRKKTQLLIHGTRNPNIFSILKEGLKIRPTNAAVISGAAYGNGIYHSLHTAKSLNYTGYDPDKLFLIQEVHMGKEYTYEGWYRAGKDLDRSSMTYDGLKKKGYDSLYVKPGDGLLNSEYIVYNEAQTDIRFLVWLT